MANYERYADIHNEIMNRLEAGEITTEQAKELDDTFFDKYITEGKFAREVVRDSGVNKKDEPEFYRVVKTFAKGLEALTNKHAKAAAELSHNPSKTSTATIDTILHELEKFVNSNKGIIRAIKGDN